MIREECLADPVVLARFVSALAEPEFVFADCHAEWMRLMTDPWPEGEQAKRMLLAPRTHGKSTIANLCATVWDLLQDPNVRILICSETDNQAKAFVAHLRKVLEHPLFVAVFGDQRGGNWSQSHGLTVAGRTTVHKEPTVMAMSVGAALPSFHFDRITLDDPIDDDDVRTEGGRAAAKRWYLQTLEPTLVRDGMLRVIGTRWHFYDLYHTLMKEAGYLCRRYQAILEWSEREDLWGEWAALRSSMDPGAESSEADAFLARHREEMFEGTEVLLPDVWNYAALMLKKMASTEVFLRQFQNEPRLGDGQEVFKQEDFRFYADQDRPRREDYLFMVGFYDLAISLKETADYFAGVQLGVMPDGRMYVVDYIQRRLTFPQQEAVIIERHGRWREDIIGIESVQYQEALSQSLKASTTLPVSSESANKSKYTRALRIQGQVENHKLFLNRRHAPVLMELCEFPFGEHDDLFDAVVGAVIIAQRDFGKFGGRKRGLKHYA